MDNLPSETQEPNLRDLQAQCESLQNLVSSLLLVLIVISGTLSIFLLRQWKFAKGELEALAPTANQMIMEHTNSYAMNQDFVHKVAEYGRTHPDFSQITLKYHLNELLPKADQGSITSSLPAGVLNKK
jgi:hypothetical protein